MSEDESGEEGLPPTEEAWAEVGPIAPKRGDDLHRADEVPAEVDETPAEDAPADEAQADADDAAERQEPLPPLDPEQTAALALLLESLLFLSSDPLSAAELADAAQRSEREVVAALELLGQEFAPGRRGLRLRELGGGFVLASDPDADEAARRLFSRPRLATLTPAQAETLAIVAYMQPISRPEIGRIRGVSADSATSTLLERGLIEESGRSQFGAALYRTTSTFLKLFGLGGIGELPDVTAWDPSPEEQAELRDRLLRAGDARAGNPASGD